ncbi:DUF2802 domain-containing protein [Salinispirillum sp. LH 10-3-1]|uniref:DUF2802 domain-containing protein n=1 Tax=Salinispirillum sp. LH 10-3-1 TaxID=2952525 RepID=A0AB38YD51_9GAMM
MTVLDDAQLLALLVPFVVLLVLVLFSLWVSAGRRNRRLTHEVEAMRRELSMIQAGNIGLGKKLLAVARQSHHVQQQFKAIKDTQSQPASSPVGNASPKSSTPQLVPKEEAKKAKVDVVVADDDSEEDTLVQFDTAQTMLRSGAQIDQVIRSTGLTRSEAELILLLNQPSMNARQ